LVLQGGGALRAYELGTAGALQGEAFQPRPDRRRFYWGDYRCHFGAASTRAQTARKAFWEKVSVPGLLFPPALRRYASFFGNANFFVPRFDYINLPTWTYFYETAPLRDTLKQVVDLDALRDRTAAPGLFGERDGT
jgi:hypothetical protein